jgi:hypothetical protein
VNSTPKPRPAALAVTLALTGSCVPRRPEPAPAPTPAPAPPPPLPRAEIDWRTAPITPGSWQWSNDGGQSVARFAGGQLVLACNPPAGHVTLSRSGAANGPVAMTILTSNEERPVTGSPRPGPPPSIAVALRARDPLLDAMAFSRGRFAVETAGQPTLYVPSWPEVSRVIEDCR